MLGIEEASKMQVIQIWFRVFVFFELAQGKQTSHESQRSIGTSGHRKTETPG